MSHCIVAEETNVGVRWGQHLRVLSATLDALCRGNKFVGPGRLWRSVAAQAGLDEGAGDPASSGDRASDDECIQTCLVRDPDSFARLVERYEGAVTRVLWHFTRDPSQLEELVQDTFVEAYFSLRRFRKGSPFYPWLRTIATRVGYRSWRRQRRERERKIVLVGLHRASDSGVVPREGADTAEYVYRVLALLEPKDRLVLTLQYMEQCSAREIAERTGWSVPLVKVRAFRARRKLRALLAEKERNEHGEH